MSCSQALELLNEDATQHRQLFLIFLSDGAPSDHIFRSCPHGFMVWQHDPNGGVHAKSGKPKLTNCPYGKHACRMAITAGVQRGS